MLIQLLVGSIVSMLNIILHATVTMIVIRTARVTARRSTSNPLLYLAGVMIAISLVLMFGWSTALIVEVLIKAIGRYTSASSYSDEL